MQGISGEKGLWSVAEEALLPRVAFGAGLAGQGWVRLRRLCLRRKLSPFISRMWTWWVMRSSFSYRSDAASATC